MEMRKIILIVLISNACNPHGAIQTDIYGCIKICHSQFHSCITTSNNDEELRLDCQLLEEDCVDECRYGE